jgi:hypothetical protein
MKSREIKSRSGGHQFFPGCGKVRRTSHKEGTKSKSMGRVSDQIRKALVVILHVRDHLLIQMLCLFPCRFREQWRSNHGGRVSLTVFFISGTGQILHD